MSWGGFSALHFEISGSSLVRDWTSPMGEILKNAVPAIIALVGTILVALLGYRQWKRQQDATRSGGFQSQKQQTYKELWDKLENIHVRLRTETVGNEDFRSLVRDVNSYILKNGLYLENDDQQLADQYLSKVREFTNLVAASNSPDAKIALEDTAAEIPPQVIQSVRDLERIQSEVNQIREKILVRYRKGVLGEVK